jgi:hypothetical protein
MPSDVLQEGSEVALGLVGDEALGSAPGVFPGLLLVKQPAAAPGRTCCSSPSRCTTPAACGCRTRKSNCTRKGNINRRDAGMLGMIKQFVSGQPGQQKHLMSTDAAEVKAA